MSCQAMVHRGGFRRLGCRRFDYQKNVSFLSCPPTMAVISCADTPWLMSCYSLPWSQPCHAPLGYKNPLCVPPVYKIHQPKIIQIKMFQGNL